MVVIFGVNNSASSHTDNEMKKFLLLGEKPTHDINDSFGTAEKHLVLTLHKQTQNFPWVYIAMVIKVICM